MDVIDTLAGIAPGSPLDAIRARRPEARSQAQASYAALFQPATPGGVSAVERFALARFVTGLHGNAVVADFYAERLAEAGASPDLRDSVEAAIAAGAAQGPYGAYPAGPLSVEDAPGPRYAATGLPTKLGPLFEHAHMLVFHPRDADAASLQALLDAGWTADDIVTVSQIVAFLAFQTRVVAGLRVMAAG